LSYKTKKQPLNASFVVCITTCLTQILPNWWIVELHIGATHNVSLWVVYTSTLIKRLK